MRTCNFGFHLLSDGVKAVRFSRGQMILDDDRLTGIDQLLQTDLVTFGEVAVLPLFQQLFNFRIQSIQLVDISLQLRGHSGIAVGIRCSLQFSQRITGISGERLKGLRPFVDNFIRFLLTIRPDSQKPGQPFLRSLLFLHKVAFAHTEERQTFAVAVEGFSSGILPVFSSFCHAFECFTCLFCTGYIVGKCNRANNHSRSDRKPDRR